MLKALVSALLGDLRGRGADGTIVDAPVYRGFVKDDIAV